MGCGNVSGPGTRKKFSKKERRYLRQEFVLSARNFTTTAFLGRQCSQRSSMPSASYSVSTQVYSSPRKAAESFQQAEQPSEG